ncbi:MAG: hypothetical protein CMI13_07750 [Oleibacter sp.]|nr:hypothetical protein [Thalassolituus sp.]
MDKQRIKDIAINNGFKLKEQPDGSSDLNPYVYAFSEALYKEAAKTKERDNKNILGGIGNIPEDQIKSLPYFQNRGRYFIRRALIQDKTGNRELAFSDAIKRFHEFQHDGGMRNIVGDNQVALEAAFTTFQWLATNCGMATLEAALNACGMKIIKSED